MTDENRPELNSEANPEVNEAKLIDAAEDAAEARVDHEANDGAGNDPAPAILSETETEEDEDEAEEEAEDDGDEDEDDADDESDKDESDEDEDEGDVTEETSEEDEDEPEAARKPRPPAKLERLQKILAQSGVASRRKAEEMIEQGRVQVNGKTVTELGTKADMGRDHIRVDGKLLHGAERLRYFVLNKPRGFVTTVKDPEGRPTVMQFFEKMRERLYPVGRLDYLSEGLLLVTNDGELANKLTRAAAGVEKTYLVKVSGIPSEGELDVLRAGVAIEKGKPGSPKVRTSPARIRQVRQGDNPWYEVVLIEGRNRELRKMFEEIGHFVEKIRRVGYGPLILDQEPGNLRELDENELSLLRKTADGTLRTPKAKDIRRRNMIDSLPPEKPAVKARGGRSASERPAAGPKDYQPKKAFGATDRGASRGAGASGPRKFGAGPAKSGSRPDTRAGEGSAARPAWKKDAPPERGSTRPPQRFTPAEGAGETRRPSAPGSYTPAPRTFGDKPAGRTFGAKPAGKAAAGRTFGDKPAWKKPESGERAGTDRPRTGRPGFDRKPPARPEATRRPAPEPFDDDEPRKKFNLHIEPVQEFDRSADRPQGSRGGSGGARQARPAAGGAPYRQGGSDRGGYERSGSERPERTPGAFGRSEGGRSSSARPFRPEGGSSRPSGPARPGGSSRPGGLARPFTTSSGKPRPGGARPSSKPGSGGKTGSYGSSAGRGSSATRGSGPAKRPFSPREGAPREGGSSFRPRSEGSAPERRTGTGWKPKPGFGGKPSPGGGRPKPGGGPKFGSRPGGSFKPGGSKGKPGGKPGGRRPSSPR